MNTCFPLFSSVNLLLQPHTKRLDCKTVWWVFLERSWWAQMMLSQKALLDQNNWGVWKCCRVGFASRSCWGFFSNFSFTNLFLSFTKQTKAERHFTHDKRRDAMRFFAKFHEFLVVFFSFFWLCLWETRCYFSSRRKFWNFQSVLSGFSIRKQPVKVSTIIKKKKKIFWLIESENRIKMNLMFRKNFRDGGSGGGSKSSSTKLNKMNRSGKRSRDMSYSGPSTDESFTQYRTHLFFNANRTGFQEDNGGLLISLLMCDELCYEKLYGLRKWYNLSENLSKIIFSGVKEEKKNCSEK